MLKMLDPLREINFYSVAFRMILACICGGIIGIEREYKHRPAGFRTHILICLGASMTTMTSQYLSLVMNYTTDISRLSFFHDYIFHGTNFRTHTTPRTILIYF